MTNGDWFLMAMSLGYTAASVAYWNGGNPGYALSLFCYAIGNLGLIYAAH